MSTRKRSANFIRGALYGFAIGDAMGATTEFMSKESIAEKYGAVTHIIGGGWLDLKPGAVTDDTQMMLCVARGMMDQDTFPDKMRQISYNFVDWLHSNPPDVGNTCHAAISQNEGFGWESWSANNKLRQRRSGRKDYGNGGLMRCLVPCLAGDLVIAKEQSRLTHTNDLCDLAILNYYYKVQKALDGLSFVPGSPAEPTGHVDNTLRCATYWGSANSIKNAILGAVNDGGDADTIAALAGALAGARYGFREIPIRWVHELDESVSAELEKIVEWLT